MQLPGHGLLGRVVLVTLTMVALLAGSLTPAAADTAPVTGSLTGTVILPAGDPASGASITIYAWRNVDSSWDDSSTAHTVAAEDGTYEVTGLGPGRYTAEVYAGFGRHYLVTWLGGHPYKEQAESFEIDADHQVVERSIQLLEAGSISGFVTSSGGVTLAGAKVTIVSDDGSFGYCTTDANGRFSLGGLYPGDYTVYVEPPSGSGLLATWWNATRFESEATKLPLTFGTVVDDVNVELPIGSSISGRLIASDSGSLGQFYVWAWQEKRDGSWTEVEFAETAADGSFKISRLFAGRYRLEFGPFEDSSYAYQWWDRSAAEDGAKSVQIDTGEAAQIGDVSLLWRVIGDGANVLTGVRPVVGQTLSVWYSLRSPQTAVRTYKWYADGVEIEGASENSYVVRAEDLDARISAREFFTGPDVAPKTVDHGETLPVKKGHFESVYPPAVHSAGVASSGSPVLSAAEAENDWSPAPTSVSYQWQRDGRDLAGENSARHEVTSADFGSELSVRIRAERPGFEPAEAVATAGMTCYPDSAVGGLVVSGVRAVGSTLTVSGGPAATKMSVSYQWRVGVTALPGQTGESITLTKDLVGKQVRAVVTGRLTGCSTITRAQRGELPMTAMASIPRITGSARVGATLKVKRGTWTRDTAFRYRWFANGKAISGATKSTLRLGKSLKGKTIAVAVTGRRISFETVTKLSPSTRRVH